MAVVHEGTKEQLDAKEGNRDVEEEQRDGRGRCTDPAVSISGSGE